MEIKKNDFIQNLSIYLSYLADKHLKYVNFLRIKRGLQCLSHGFEHWQLMQTMTSPVSRKLLERYPKIRFKYLRNNYLLHTLSTRDAVAILRYHYQTLNVTVKENFLQLIFEAPPVLWQHDTGTQNFSIKLSFPRKLTFPFDLVDHEGDLSLVFEADGVPLGVVSLTLIPGDVVERRWHFNGCKRAMFIARVQGVPDQLSSINAATKTLFYNTPLRLLISAVQGVAKALATDTIIGVSTNEQLARFSEFNKTETFFDYDQFWLQLGAKKLTDQVFFMPVDIPEKPFEEVRPNQRPRALKKRKLRAIVINEVCASFSDNFLSLNESPKE